LFYRYEESAVLYAQTRNSFEEVALKFIRLDRKDALRSFILKKLSSLSSQVKFIPSILSNLIPIDH
jgi:hypothetical protein